MRLRSFVFLLFFFVSTNHFNSQGPDIVTAVNNPFAETVKPVLELESGQLVVKLVNGFPETVLLTRVVLSQDGAEPRSLLQSVTDFWPAETKYFNVDLKSIDLRQKLRLMVDLSPRPPKQTLEFVFRFEAETGQFVEGSEGQKPAIWRRPGR